MKLKSSIMTEAILYASLRNELLTKDCPQDTVQFADSEEITAIVQAAINDILGGA